MLPCLLGQFYLCADKVSKPVVIVEHRSNEHGVSELCSIALVVQNLDEHRAMISDPLANFLSKPWLSFIASQKLAISSNYLVSWVLCELAEGVVYCDNRIIRKIGIADDTGNGIEPDRFPYPIKIGFFRDFHVAPLA